MKQENKERAKIREYIVGEARNRAELMGENESAVEKIIEGKQSLIDSGLFDSLSFLDLLAALEDKFNIEIDLGSYDLEDFVMLDGLTNIVIESKDKPDDFDESNAVENEFVRIVDGIVYEELNVQHPCWDQLASVFKSLYEYMETFDLYVPLKLNGAELWLNSLKHGLGKTQIVIGAVDDGKLIGYFHAVIKILPIYLEGNYVGEFMSMYVMPEYRKRKIADQMINRAFQWMKMKNISSIEAKVMTKNVPVIKFWKNRGFKEELIQLRNFEFSENEKL